MPVLDRPPDEVGGLVAVGSFSAAGPPFHVALAAGCEREPSAGQPVQESRGRGDVAADVEGLQVGGGAAAQPLPELAQMVPGRVAVQDAALARIVLAAGRFGGPLLKAGEDLVAFRQRAGGDQHAAQVRQRLACGQFVEDLVGKVPVLGADFSQQLAGPGPSNPDQRAVGALGAGQRLVERGNRWPDDAVLAAEEAADVLGEHAAQARPGAQLPGLPAGRAAFPERGVGVDAAGAQRLPAGPAADRGDGAAPVAACPPLLAPLAPWLPGGPGDLSRGLLPADAAFHNLARPA
jgi:hypothetical protein